MTTYDKRYNPDTSIEHDVDNQRKVWQELSQPLIDVHKESKNEKIGGLLHGNHEYNIKVRFESYDAIFSYDEVIR